MKIFCHKASTDRVPGQVASGLSLFWNSFLEPFCVTKKMKQLSNAVNCYASPESGKMNNDDTYLVKKKSKVLQIWLQNKYQKRVYSTHTVVFILKVVVKMF